MVQASKMELSGHCGYGFRHISASLRTWTLWPVSNSRSTPPMFSKQYLLAAASYNLVVSKSPSLYNYVITLNPNKYLLNKHPYFLPAPILIVDNLCNLAVFAFISFPHFVVQWNTTEVLSWICSSSLQS